MSMDKGLLPISFCCHFSDRNAFRFHLGHVAHCLVEPTLNETTRATAVVDIAASVLYDADNPPVELLLQALIGIVDAQLLKAVLLEALKAIDIKNAQGGLSLLLAN